LLHFVTNSPWEADALWTRLRIVVPPREALTPPNTAKASTGACG
jgi:SRSO17 transposase